MLGKFAVPVVIAIVRRIRVTITARCSFLWLSLFFVLFEVVSFFRQTSWIFRWVGGVHLHQLQLLLSSCLPELV